MRTDEVDELFMREALAEARFAAAEGEVPIGAVVVHEGVVIARAHNRRETDADPSAHAEFSAMLQASRHLGRWRLTGCTVYVTLEPCLMCAGLMVNARIDRCVFGAADPKGGALGTLYRAHDDERLNHAFEVTSGILADTCAEELRAFFASLRGKDAKGTGSPSPLSQNQSARPVHVGSPSDATDALPPSPTAASNQATPSNPAPCGKTTPHATTMRKRTQMPAREHGADIVLAVDSFKGSATSEQVERWLQEGMLRAMPQARIVCVPLADGGEGTVDAFAAAMRAGTVRRINVTDAMGAQTEARYLLVPAGDARDTDGSLGERASETPADASSPASDEAHTPACAVMEMAQAAGLGGSARTHDAALTATTGGVGTMVLDAIARGARTIYVGLGGSATTDGGAGMLQALGAKLLDGKGEPIAPGLTGLRDVASIDLEPARRALAGVELIALHDVTNPLCGPHGTVRVFGPQKGLGAGMSDMEREHTLDELDRCMASYGAFLTAARDALDGTPWQVAQAGKRPKSLIGVPGAGAAGGLGAALLALGAKLTSGVDALLDAASFDCRARDAAVIVTGEGSLDAQTRAGKAPVGVARRAKKANPRARVVAVCGARDDDLSALYEAGIDIALPVMRKPLPLDDALSAEETRRNLTCAGETIARALLAR